MDKQRVFAMAFSRVYPLLVAKVERKRRTRAEVDEVIRWQTDYSQAELEAALAANRDYAGFYAEAPALNPARALVTGKVCGVDVQKVEDPLMREIRILDKLVDELAKGRPMARVLRQA